MHLRSAPVVPALLDASHPLVDTTATDAHDDTIGQQPTTSHNDNATMSELDVPNNATNAERHKANQQTLTHMRKTLSSPCSAMENNVLVTQDEVTIAYQELRAVSTDPQKAT